MKGERRSDARFRILIIDDDRYVAEFFMAFFEEDRYSVQVVADADAGREAIVRGDYDILFLDESLPGEDGLDMLKNLGEALDPGKVVVVLGEMTPGLNRRVCSLGVRHCLTKPFDLEEIREVVGR